MVNAEDVPLFISLCQMISKVVTYNYTTHTILQSKAVELFDTQKLYALYMFSVDIEL